MKKLDAARAATVKALAKNRGELEATTLLKMLALAEAAGHGPTPPAQGAGRLQDPLRQA
jgi:hypothetical protein